MAAERITMVALSWMETGSILEPVGFTEAGPNWHVAKKICKPACKPGSVPRLSARRRSFI